MLVESADLGDSRKLGHLQYMYMRSTDRLFKDVFLKYLQNVSDEQETGFLLHP